ncbi:hypothetical protein EOM39_07325 [Candidatus Gracilibacteria bacterium]|nr:hypothetical protein [Candidatus Gracilibacteria bacterium]
MDKTFKLSLIFSLVFIMSVVYLWGGAYLDFKKENAQVLQEVYTDLGNNYQIGKYHKVNSICNKDEKIGCLNGEIKGIKIINNREYYLYLYIYRSPVTSTYPNGEKEITDYSYHLFFNNKSTFVQKEQDIPKFGYLSNNELKFYTENDLSKLPQEQQTIFKELEKNPTIVINGVDYTKK